MRLHLVFGSEFRTTCDRCGQKAQGGYNHELYADLDGPAFKAYYHKECLTPEELKSAKKSEWS